MWFVEFHSSTDDSGRSSDKFLRAIANSSRQPENFPEPSEEFSGAPEKFSRPLEKSPCLVGKTFRPVGNVSRSADKVFRGTSKVSRSAGKVSRSAGKVLRSVGDVSRTVKKPGIPSAESVEAIETQYFTATGWKKSPFRLAPGLCPCTVSLACRRHTLEPGSLSIYPTGSSEARCGSLASDVANFRPDTATLAKLRQCFTASSPGPRPGDEVEDRQHVKDN
jgi:hypothetical protein